MKTSAKINWILALIFTRLPIIGFGQNNAGPKVVNAGKMSMESNSLVSVAYDFSNLPTAQVISDGTIMFYRDFNNDGFYESSVNKKTGKTYFTRWNQEQGAQVISGDAISSFHDIIFDNSQSTMAFDIKNNIDIHGKAEFKQGILKVDSTQNPITKVSRGMVSFLKDSSWEQASDISHVDGYVEKIGKMDFTFPKGNKSMYRPAIITSAKEDKDAYLGRYVFDDSNFFHARSPYSGVIEELNTKEYWIIEKATNSATDIVLTLTWDSRTTPKKLLDNPEKDLHIVRWDSKQNLWVDEGGIVDIASRQITTPVSVKGYGFFTLAKVKTDWILDGDVVIYNLVSSNEDNINDYFLIENIQRFPNNSVHIFNRWGVKVFETTNYDPQGDGSVNVFRGYSDGRATIAKNEKLPTGTYYYIVAYEFKDANGARMIKKSGYLQLETN
ncbi:gliding motility-associated C-terminal domain-containing protein [Myroides sp. LJL115]